MSEKEDWEKELDKYERSIFEKGRQEAIKEVIIEIKKRDLTEYMGLCFSIKDINNGLGLPLLTWLEKLKEKRT